MLTVANISGANNIKVTDAGGTAQFVPISTGGIVLVRTGGAGANTAAFVLDPGSTGYATFGPTPVQAGLVKGVWLYTLANTGQNEVLVSRTQTSALRASDHRHGGAGHLRYATAPWQDRQADLRDSVLLAPGDLGSFTPGVWTQGGRRLDQPHRQVQLRRLRLRPGLSPGHLRHRRRDRQRPPILAAASWP